MTGTTVTVAALLAVQTMVTASFVALPVVAPAAAQDLGLDPGLIGVFTALGYVGMMLAQMLSGALVRRFGPVRVSQLGLVTVAMGNLLAATGNLLAATGIALMLVPAALLLGLGHSAPTPAASDILFRHTPARTMGFLMSVKETGVPLGAALSAGLLPLLLLALDWQSALLLSMLPCLAVALLLQPLRAKFDGERDPDHRLCLSALPAPVITVLRLPAVRRVTFAAAGFGALQWCFLAFFIVYLVDELHIALLVAGLAMAAAQACGVVGRVLWGIVSDRLGDGVPVLVALGLAMTASALLMAAYSDAWPMAAIVAVAALMGLSANGYTGVYLAEIGKRVDLAEVVMATAGSNFIM